MNIINRALLSIALSPAALYRRMGVNLPQLKAIVHTKLVMDDRRPTSFQQTRIRKQKKPVSLATIGTMVMSVLLGAVFLFCFRIGEDRVTQLTFYFSLFFFMLSATLISDFTSVLIDVRDNYIILPKPVSDRTVVVARLLHIFIHICKIVLPMSLPGLVFIGYATGWLSVPAFLIVVILVTVSAIFFINAVYLLILRITTPQKFQAIISYIQIIFAVIIYASYQIVPRLMTQLNLSYFNVSDQRGILFYPIYWFAALWQMLYHWQGRTVQVIGAVLGLIVPLGGLFAVIKYLAPSFNNKLALINSTTGGAPEQTKEGAVKKAGKHDRYSSFLSRLFTRGQAERMGFLFTWKMTARSRDFKMKVYPSIGYLAVYVVVMFLNSREHALQRIAQQDTAGRFIVISALYFTSFLLTMAINQVVYSDKFKASWIYYVAPLKRPGEVVTGATKAAILKFYIPIVVIITIAGIALIGPSVLPNIFLGLVNELLIATLLVYMGHKVFPFSMHQSNAVRSGSFIRNMGVMSISALIGIGHFLIYTMLPAVMLCTVLSLLATWLLMGSIKNTSWAEIKSKYEE